MGLTGWRESERRRQGWERRRRTGTTRLGRRRPLKAVLTGRRASAELGEAERQGDQMLAEEVIFVAGDNERPDGDHVTAGGCATRCLQRRRCFRKVGGAAGPQQAPILLSSCAACKHLQYDCSNSASNPIAPVDAQLGWLALHHPPLAGDQQHRPSGGAPRR